LTTTTTTMAAAASATAATATAAAAADPLTRADITVAAYTRLHKLVYDALDADASDDDYDGAEMRVIHRLRELTSSVEALTIDASPEGVRSTIMRMYNTARTTFGPALDNLVENIDRGQEIDSVAFVFQFRAQLTQQFGPIGSKSRPGATAAYPLKAPVGDIVWQESQSSVTAANYFEPMYSDRPAQLAATGRWTTAVEMVTARPCFRVKLAMPTFGPIDDARCAISARLTALPPNSRFLKLPALKTFLDRFDTLVTCIHDKRYVPWVRGKIDRARKAIYVAAADYFDGRLKTRPRLTVGPTRPRLAVGPMSAAMSKATRRVSTADTVPARLEYDNEWENYMEFDYEFSLPKAPDSPVSGASGARWCSEPEHGLIAGLSIAIGVHFKEMVDANDGGPAVDSEWRASRRREVVRLGNEFRLGEDGFSVCNDAIREVINMYGHFAAERFGFYRLFVPSVRIYTILTSGSGAPRRPVWEFDRVRASFTLELEPAMRVAAVTSDRPAPIPGSSITQHVRVVAPLDLHNDALLFVDYTQTARSICPPTSTDDDDDDDDYADSEDCRVVYFGVALAAAPTVVTNPDQPCVEFALRSFGGRTRTLEGEESVANGAGRVVWNNGSFHLANFYTVLVDRDRPYTVFGLGSDTGSSVTQMDTLESVGFSGSDASWLRVSDRILYDEGADDRPGDWTGVRLAATISWACYQRVPGFFVRTEFANADTNDPLFATQIFAVGKSGDRTQHPSSTTSAAQDVDWDRLEKNFRIWLNVDDDDDDDEADEADW